MTANGLRPYPAYRDSGLPELGKVPEHWEVRRLKNVAKLIYGDSLAANSRRSGDIPVYGSNGRVGLHDMANTEGPVVIVGRKGSFGRVNYSDSPVFAIDTTFFVDGRSTSVDLRLLCHLLAWLRLDEVTKDSAIPGLDREDAYQRIVPLPPLSEQLAIVRFLDHADHRIRRYIRAKERLVELLEERKRALIHEAVTGRIDVRTGQPYPAYKDSGVEWLGEVPEHWEVRRLGATTERLVAGTWGSDPTGRDDIICVRVADFDRQRLGVDLRAPTLRSVPLSERQGRLLEAGDLLLEKSGGGDLQPVGAVVHFDHDQEAVASNFIGRVRVRGQNSARYVLYLNSVLYALRITVRSIKQTTGIQNLDVGAYLGESVPLPPLSEQTAIVGFLDDADRRIQRHISATKRQIVLLKEYRTRLIADVVTGKLDVRDVAARLISPTKFASDRDGGIPRDALDAKYAAPLECGPHSNATCKR